MYTEQDHTFAICAYKENPHLEETIVSLENQTRHSTILLSTSTPNDYLLTICAKHGIEMFVNPSPHLAGDDWNYAYEIAKTPLVTLAHQDDIYEPLFIEKTLEYINKNVRDDAIIAFSDYYEIRPEGHVETSSMLRIKRLMNSLLLLPGASRSEFMRHRFLSIGCSICCPAVTYKKTAVGKNPFDTKYINSCDYSTWVKLANKTGAFIYIPERLVGHRIYADSSTTHNLDANIRKREDLEIMNTFWPKPIASFINHFYSKSEKNNTI